MQFSNADIITNRDMSGNILSVPVINNQLFGATLQAIWTGMPVGTLLLQFSNFRTNNVYGIGIPEDTWITVSDASVAINITDSDGDQAFGWFDTPGTVRWWRIQYIATSGSGNLNAQYSAKAP